MVKGDNRRIAITAGGLILSAPASYVVQRALSAWGVLDDVSDSLGRWLKVHVPPATAGWTIALLFVLVIYGLLLRKVWRPRHIHHVDPAPEQIKFGDSVKAQIVPAPTEQKKSASEYAAEYMARAIRLAEPDIAAASLAAKYGPRQRDAVISEGLGYAVYGEWGRGYIEAILAGKVPQNEPLEKFRQLASDGRLTVWGKRPDSGLFELISKEHWIEHRLNISDLMGRFGTSEGAAPFTDIMVSRVEIEREWPHAN